MIGEGVESQNKLDQAREAVQAATQTVKETTQSVADAVEAGRQPGAPLDPLGSVGLKKRPCTQSLSRSWSVFCLGAANQPLRSAFLTGTSSTFLQTP